MTPPEDIETLADLEAALDKVAYTQALPSNASLAVILGAALGEENKPEWSLYSEVHHLLDASLVRCCLDPSQGDDDLSEPVRQRLEAAWRTARLVNHKVRSIEALHRIRLREANAEIESLREEAGIIEDVCPLLRAVVRTAESYARDLGTPQWAPFARLAWLMHEAARSHEPMADVAERLRAAAAALAPVQTPPPIHG